MLLLASTMSMFASRAWKNGHSRYMACSIAMPSSGCAASQALTAVPKPYQPGSIRRHCAQLNTQGIARRSSMLRVCLREAGRLPMFSVGDLGDRPWTPRSSARSPASRRPGRGRPGRRWPTAPPWRRGTPRAAPPSGWSSVASSVAAARVSRLRRPTSGLAYLPAITSPCSVMRIWPCTAPPGWARIAWWLGPPPRPTEPPRPWNRRSLMPCRRKTSIRPISALYSSQPEVTKPPSLLLSE